MPVHSFPRALQPAVVLAVGVMSAAEPLLLGLWPALALLLKFAVRLAIWGSPVLILSARKWVSWYIGGYIRKAQRLLGWAGWLLGLLPKGAGAGGGAAAGAAGA